MSAKKLGLSIMFAAIIIALSVFAFHYQVSGTVIHPRINDTMQILVVPYFSPTSYFWQTIYDQASMYPGTIKYVVINPCSGPCNTPLTQDWEDVIFKLKSENIKTLGYIFNTSENFRNIDYYLKDPQVPMDGIFF